MSQLNEHDLPKHVTIVAWINIITNAILLSVGCLVFFLLAGIGIVINNAEASLILAIAGLCMGWLMILLALPGIISGIGLLKRKAWGRILAIVVGVFSLFNCPVGTIIGGYTLFVLLQESATPYFAGADTEAAVVDTVSEQ